MHVVAARRLVVAVVGVAGQRTVPATVEVELEAGSAAVVAWLAATIGFHEMGAGLGLGSVASVESVVVVAWQGTGLGVVGSETFAG